MQVRLVLGVAMCFVACVAAGPAMADIIELESYTQTDGSTHWYGLLASVTGNPTRSSWTDARSAAIAEGGRLVTIEDAAENTWLYSTYVTTKGYDDHIWIGYYSPTSSLSSWSWESGISASYSNWRGGQPDAGTGADYYAAMNFKGYGSVWDNFPVSGTFFGTPRAPYALVEFTSNPSSPVVPEPTSVVLMALGLGGLALRVRRRQ